MRKNIPQRSAEKSKPVSAKAKRDMLVLIALCIVAMLVYFGTPAIGIPVLSYCITGLYMIALAVMAIVYIAYNYAFTRNDISLDDLPSDWSDEKKQEYISRVAQHKQSSRWMLFVIFPLAVTFIADFLYLYVWDGFLSNLFS